MSLTQIKPLSYYIDGHMDELEFLNKHNIYLFCKQDPLFTEPQPEQDLKLPYSFVNLLESLPTLPQGPVFDY